MDMTSRETQEAYSDVAGRYIDQLGSIDSVDEADRLFIAEGFKGVTNSILDVGCGPGHLTAYLNSLGHQAAGIDLVPQFVNHARRAYPGIEYSVIDIESFEGDVESAGGVLAWYSLIHMTPEDMLTTLETLSRILVPEGVLVYGGFLADSRKLFAHKVFPATAYSEDDITSLIEYAGFRVSRVETRPATAQKRAHIAVTAVRA
ncbi:class I SAM-dependent methyltransferase [Corynebacterium genitalium ATCC 33030]|uniref:Methyltransferase domain protein n=1 Tax=Corynebacterium genitalium ATCC 33030 TaxID=585529 RepID=D7WAM3_9CORY|nr:MULTISPECIES: class I SAM-dependent methyltransferase [Corynebacterium]EFK54904.1 methyltransferase domain protein [Corynebacterium genitalium ATCC 33030]MCQ4622368.1 class I SAM-dependent methyltransferase [Corynebacterium sp. CCUG 70398]MCQ4626500.1 class I SAM-dependent methyltransferase [Corynebacterium sp. CCUG 65737]UUA89804.1 class I SAM-dependent methyltransferase [Corynebacterium genitalium ATCC 33030]